MPENPDQAIPESDKLHSEDDDGGSSQETPQPSLPDNGAMGYPHNHIISSQCQEHQAAAVRKSPKIFTRSNLVICFTGIVMAATVVQAHTTCSQGKIMESQGGIMKEQLLASRRPWVGVDVSLTGDMEADIHGYTVRLKYTTQNYGTTPAVGVYLHPQIVLWTPGFDLDREQKKVCEMGMDPAVFSVGGHDLFPAQKNETYSGFGLSKSEIEKSLEVYRQTLGNDAPFTFINPFIMGCVTYRSTFDDTVHRTPFRVQLVREDPKIIGNFLSLNTSIGTIPMKSIFVKPEISIGEIRAD
jgi:hypothetical protein